nr:amino acid ABC transporter substrate-binding protein [Lactobacillus colini]
MKKINTVLLFLMIFLVSTGCQNLQKKANTQDTWSRIEHKKKIVIGLDDSFVPMGFETKAGKLVGYDIDLAKAVFKLYGIKADFQTIDWSMKETELRNGTIDLIWNGYSKTAERAKKVAFSTPYLKNRQVLVVKKDSGITNFAGMKTKNLGLQTGSTAQTWYDGKQNILKAKSSVLYDTIPNEFLDLNAGRIQGIFLDEVYANYYIPRQKDSSSYRVIINNQVPADYFAVGMRKGDKTLKNKIDQAFIRLKKDGQLAKINKKWFGKAKLTVVQ